MSYTGSKAKVGRKSIVYIGGVSGVSGGTFVVIEEVNKASFSGSKYGTVDVTNFDSGVDDEFIATTRDNGSVSLSGNYIDNAPGQDALNTACDAGVKYDFKIQLAAGPGQTAGKTFTFSALVLSFLDIPIETRSAIQWTADLKVSGKITVIPAVASA